MADAPLPGVPPGLQGGFAPVVPGTVLRISAALRDSAAVVSQGL